MMREQVVTVAEMALRTEGADLTAASTDGGRRSRGLAALTWALALLAACPDGARPDRWCPDADGDGYAAPPCGNDCDDNDPTAYPWAPEIRGDGIDQNCDGVELPQLTVPEPSDTGEVVDLDGDGWQARDDCDDSDPSVFGQDEDGDAISACDGDCDDTDPAVHPGAERVCGNGVDDDCDGVGDCEHLGPVSVPDVAAARFIPGGAYGGRTSPKSVRVADSNGDGVQDVLVDLDDLDPPDVNRLHLVAGPLVADVVDLGKASVAAFTWNGRRSFATGDIDGDGMDDVVISTDLGAFVPGVLDYFYAPFSGVLTRADASASIEPAGFDSAGPTETGDVDDDGLADVLIGEPGGRLEAFPGLGFAFVLFGARYGDHGQEAHDVILLPEDPADRMGDDIAAGDVTGDGVADVVVSATRAHPSAVYLVSGPVSPGVHSLTDAVRVEEAGPYDQDCDLGSAIDAGVDTDGDGYGDLVAASGHNCGQVPLAEGDGAVYLIPGPVGEGQAPDLAMGRILTEEDVGYYAMLATPDADGDGLPDVLVSNAFDVSREGTVYLVYSPVHGTVAAREAGAAFTSPAGTFLGTSLAVVPDRNADGADEFLITVETDLNTEAAAWLIHGVPSSW